VTLMNESARRLAPRAPRLDTLGLRALALAGDLVSNTLFSA